MRQFRDVVTLSVGVTLCLSQVLVQWQSKGLIEPNAALITAGVGLLTTFPFFKIGDRRGDDAPKGRHEVEEG